MTSVPWAQVHIDGQFEHTETEFLHTNGAGAYAMSTLALLHTRREHGLLVAALDPPLRRYVILSHVDTVVTTSKRTYRLGSYQFPEVAPTPGYRYLRSFAQDPLPRFGYRLGTEDLEISLSLVRGENALILAYRWLGSDSVRIDLKPLLAMRPVGEPSREHGAMLQRVSIRQGGVEIQPLPHLPPLVLRHGGVFMGSPDWWRRFEFAEDKAGGVACEQDLWTPGTIELSLDPGRVEHVTVALERLPSGTAVERMEEMMRHLQSLDPGEEHVSSVRALSIAADAFRADQCARPAVIAGYPHLASIHRDTLVSLPGLYLVTGRVDDAKRVLLSVLEQGDDGALGHGVAEDGTPNRELTADGSLWLFEAARLLVQRCPTDDDFVSRELYPRLLAIYRRIESSTSPPLWRSSEGFLVNSAPHMALTWMDSRVRDRLLTPRRGMAIEIQALWSAALHTLGLFAGERSEPELLRSLQQERVKLISAFKACFWCVQTGYPYDCLNDAGSLRYLDPAIRPNALLALDIAPDLFESWQAIRILEVARQHLITPRGVRSLSVQHAEYLGHYEEAAAERPVTYHRGASWPFLLGAYARAALRVNPNDFELQIELRRLLEGAVENGLVLGQVPQVAAGDPPYHAGGCPAQAWNVAEILRVLREDLDL